MHDDAMALYGTAGPPDEEHRLKAGPLTALFTGGGLRAIAVDGVEVIRGIAFLVRDERWGTLIPTLSDVVVEQAPGRFTVSFDAWGRGVGGDLRWAGKIEGSIEHGLSFHVTATPEADFATCRTGFVVLHPIARTAGAPAALEHTDGTTEATRFPLLVDPLQCFTDVRAISHEALPGLQVTCTLAGDAPFETEDHRNWLDASYKTYFRPLAMPWPYTLKAGVAIEQAVTVTFDPGLESRPESSSADAAPMCESVTVTVGDLTGAVMPEVGLALNLADLAAAEAALPQLLGLCAQFLAVRLTAADRDLPGVLRRVARLATALGVAPRLELVLPLAHRAEVELDLVATASASAGLRWASVTVSPAADLKSYPPSVDRPPGPPLAELYAAARQAFPGVPVGGGMFSFFTELNRRRLPAHLVDYVSHATCAVVHAADDRSVMETLESLPHVIRSTRATIGGRPYRLGPAQIGMPFNPYGASVADNPDRQRRAMVRDDPRAGAQFGAAWAAGTLCRAAGGGLEAITLLAPAGPFGIATAEGRTPSFAVIDAFARAAGRAVLAAASSEPQRVLAAAWQDGARRFAVLVNLQPTVQPVRLAGLKPTQVTLLAAGAAAPQGQAGLEALPPYAVAFVQG